MSEDMTNAMKKISTILNDKDIPNDLKDMLNQYIHNSSTKNSNTSKNNRNIDDFPDFNNFASSFGDANSQNSTDSGDSTNPFSNIDIGTIMKLKNVMEKMNNKKDDPRSNLLLSLKPYLKSSRKDKVDQYIQLLSVGSIIENLGPIGGEKSK